MLPSIEILARLDEINRAYLAETDNIKALLWAKLAALEVGGWTEECIDKIVKDYLDTVNPPSKGKLLAQLDNLHGFKYAKEFKSIWKEIIGCIMLDKIEKKKNIECQRLASALNDLKRSRDISAHTYTKTDTSIDAPSKIIELLKQIETGLLVFINEVNSLNLKVE